ncbi:hypothetical protein GIB67_043077, partial [Kingdonia uniflora]
LYKDAGEDVIQIFDLSIIPKSHSSEGHDNMITAITFYGTSSRAKCRIFFKKCLNFLDEQDRLVFRASAHEQFARLILKCYEELDLTSEYILLEYEARVTDVEDESSDFPMGLSELVLDDKSHSEVSEEDTSGKINIFSRNQGRHLQRIHLKQVYLLRER